MPYDMPGVELESVARERVATLSLHSLAMTLSACLRTVFVATLTLLASGALGQAPIDPALQARLDGLGPFQSASAVVVFDRTGAPTASDLQALSLAGVVHGIGFQALPIAGILASPEAIHAVAALPSVRSIWLNAELEYFNDEPRQLTGVDRVRTEPSFRQGGLPLSGRGVSVLINDSGIDATHADLEYGTRVVENAQGLTNLQAYSGVLPITYIEGQLNTDLNSGHGTHCAGTVGGSGARSGGLYEGVAPGADLVGYGSGGGLFILDALGGLDYALVNRFRFDNPIKVVSNSWGSSGDFDPEHPVNQATYRLYQSGINVVFAAGNAGGENTHNPYAKAPWVISVAAGDSRGRLAGFSSRGTRGVSQTFTMYDGTTWTAVDEPTITAPGVDVISARATINGTSNGGERDAEVISPAHLPFYTMISGTSMATPHVAGIIALVLEAKPAMSPDRVRETLRATATNLPGRETWEAGSGYVNAYAAVQSALRLHPLQFGRTLTVDLNASALVSSGGTQAFSLAFSPVGDSEIIEFDVPEGMTRVTARATVGDNLIAIVLTDPEGNRYGSSISIPVLGESVAASGPGVAGTWTLEARGVGSVSGIPTDPLGITNGTSLPGQIEGTISSLRSDGFTGLDDIEGHPRAGDVEYGIARALFDARQNGFKPHQRLTRRDMARYLTMGAGVRQSFPLGSSLSFTDVKGQDAPWIEAATASGGALRDLAQTQAPVILASGGTFDPTGFVTRAEMAYAFVQALGLEEAAAGYTGDVTVEHDGERVAVVDQDDIPAAYRGYVQLAIDLALLDVSVRERRGVTEILVRPNADVSRIEYAVPAALFFDAYLNDLTAETPDGKTLTGATPVTPEASGEDFTAVLALAGPNPARSHAALRLSLPRESAVTVSVFDVTGREVVRLAEGEHASGDHTLDLDASGLSAGTYLVRAMVGGQTASERITIVR